MNWVIPALGCGPGNPFLRAKFRSHQARVGLRVPIGEGKVGMCQLFPASIAIKPSRKMEKFCGSGLRK